MRKHFFTIYLLKHSIGKRNITNLQQDERLGDDVRKYKFFHDKSNKEYRKRERTKNSGDADSWLWRLRILHV